MVPSFENFSQLLDGHFPTDSNMSPEQNYDNLHQKTFDNSVLPNIISIVGNGKIIAANRAAQKLLGYPGKGLLSKNFNEIFTLSGGQYEKMLKSRAATGYITEDLTVIRKDGKPLSCQITSVLFTGNNNITKAITTIVDRSEWMRRQSEIDLQKEKKQDAEVIYAHSKSDATIHRLHGPGQIHDQEITANETPVSPSETQRQLFEKELQWAEKLKAIQIANAVSEAKEMVRSDLGKELHDNVNQILAAARIFMDLARRNSKNRKDNITRSSEYTLTAIEEIRKIAKGLVNNAIKNVGLCVAIRKMTKDLMLAFPIKIICKMDESLHTRTSERFNLDLFRIVQEQLNNIIKHAQATSVRIVLNQKEAEIVLIVADNGVGFDVTRETDGIGIINIKSRVEFYHGSATFASQPGKGCVLTARFPVEKVAQ